MILPIYQVDAFTDTMFRGNPAAVCPLDDWLDDGLMQAIAMENNLSETAFYVGSAGAYHIRWFTPEVEVDLCGHATLATAHVIFSEREKELKELHFQSRSGELVVRREGARYSMDFPAKPAAVCGVPELLLEGLGIIPEAVYEEDDYLVVLRSEAEVRALQPDFGILRRLDRRGVIVTAPGDGCDFVSRFFGPAVGIDEDPVTGSAHCTLTPYWAERLGKRHFAARQVSPRGGSVACTLVGDRVLLSGACTTFMRGTIVVPSAHESPTKRLPS